jgi:hypothetical protein
VLLRPPARTPAEWGAEGAVTPAAAATNSRTGTSLNGSAALIAVGDTAFGQLWRSDAPTDAATNGPIPRDAGGLFGLVTTIIAFVVIGATVLLSIPTGAGREAVRQAHRDAIRRASRLSKPPKPTRVPRTPRAPRTPRPPRVPRSERPGAKVKPAKVKRGGLPVTGTISPGPAVPPDAPAAPIEEQKPPVVPSGAESDRTVADPADQKTAGTSTTEEADHGH